MRNLLCPKRPGTKEVTSCMWGCDAGVDARCLALSYLINDLFLNFTHPPSPIIPLMVFSSSIFLFAFLPLFLAVYFLMPKRAAKNIGALGILAAVLCMGRTSLRLAHGLLHRLQLGFRLRDKRNFEKGGGQPAKSCCSSLIWLSTSSSLASTSTRAFSRITSTAPSERSS